MSCLMNGVGIFQLFQGPKRTKGERKKEEFTLLGLTSILFLTVDTGSPGALVAGR